jgi:hypothetical protein
MLNEADDYTAGFLRSLFKISLVRSLGTLFYINSFCQVPDHMLYQL